MRELAGFLGRLLLAGLFLAGAGQKATDPAPVMELLQGKGLPGWLVWPAMVYDLAAGLALIGGLWLGPVALSAAAYCVFTSWFHYQPQDPWQMTIFVKNWAIAGGLLSLAACDGAWDTRRVRG